MISAGTIRRRDVLGRRVSEPRRVTTAGAGTTYASADDDALRQQARTPGLSRRSRLEALTELAAVHLSLEGTEHAASAGDRAGHRRQGEVMELAEAFLKRGMVERPPPTLLAAGLAVAASVVASEGRSFHVLSLDDTALRLAGLAAPLLDALELDWSVINADPSSSRGADAFGQRIIFVRLRELTLAHMRDTRILGQAASSGVRANVARLGGLARSARPAIRIPLDTALFVDAEQSLAESSMMAVVATDSGVGTLSAAGFASEAIGVAGQLSGGRDYRQSADRILLTSHGRDRLAGLCRCLGPGWDEPARAELAVTAALEARDLWQLDRDYRINDGRVEPVSEQLSARERAAPAGLTPTLAIDVAEGLAMPREGGMRERITLRAIALAYPHRAAAVAGLDRCAEELERVYGLRSFGRRTRPVRLYANEAAAARRIFAGQGTIVLLAGGKEDRAREAATRLSAAADPDLAASLRRAAAAEGVHSIEGCLWWPGPWAGCQFLREQASRLGRIEVIALGASALPPIADLPRTRFTALSNAFVLPARHGALLRSAAWVAARLVPVGPLARWIWWRCMAEDGRPDADLRSKLHEFDRHCRRAVGFLSHAGRME